MHRIEVDDQVYALLQQHAKPFVDRENDVLRRLLGLDLGFERAKEDRRPDGDLMGLIEAELLIPGDELIHVQTRKRRTHRAVVTTDGHLRLPDGSTYAKPSPALKACVGHDINGWGQWTHVRSGKPLQVLREKLLREPE
ncbi:restriction system modified-DNA reader domain-containing protein [Micromonospora zamorensis]|uniref:restriction system modified-DNA reader domain-containing protein n=1 Tax=Micromonospora zamorensis TaxID=709883 RepID=UPI00379AFA18